MTTGSFVKKPKGILELMQGKYAFLQKRLASVKTIGQEDFPLSPDTIEAIKLMQTQAAIAQAKVKEDWTKYKEGKFNAQP